MNLNIKKDFREILKMSIRKVLILSVASVCIIVACNKEPNRNNKEFTTWQEYGGGPSASKYVTFKQINKSNVDQLKVAWFYPTNDNKTYQFNPIIVDTVMYVLAKNNSLVALNARTGKEIWIQANLRGITRRGINFWESKDGKDKRLIFAMNNYLEEINATTGKSILSFGKNGLVDLTHGLGRDPKTLSRAQSNTPGEVYKNLIILGTGTGESYMSPPGFIRAYNVLTGKLVWTFHTLPQPGEFGYNTWPKDAYKYIGGVNCWGEMSLDMKRGIVYCPVGSPTYDYYGADRIGKDLFGDCLVALDASTGKLKWYFQFVHHDLWDSDPAAAPQLITVNHDGKRIPAVAQATKQGFLFVFNRVTGKPLWPIKERPVPKSHTPGEQSWPTQPFPTVVPPFSRQGMTPNMVSPYLLTKKEQAYWKKRIDTSQTGLYTPLSTKHATVALPGAVGGSNWGSTASNPKTGVVYVHNNAWPSFYPTLKKVKSTGGNKKHWVSPIAEGKNIFMKNCQACHGANRQGNGSAPSLVDLGDKVTPGDFTQIVGSGRGEMPSFSYLSTTQVRDLYIYLAGAMGSGSGSKLPSGPVVGSGGAPGGLKARHVVRKGGISGPPYPKGVKVPPQRYYFNGWGLGYPYVIRPPWSTIVAYDLNTGKIKWKIPLGTDKSVEEATGKKNTGVPKSQRKGMIVTSTGLLFSTAGDGHVYAYDASTGKTLWKAKLPMGTEGMPSMYEVDGREYLVVTSTSPLTWAADDMKSSGETPRSGVTVNDNKSHAKGGYVVFALPKK